VIDPVPDSADLRLEEIRMRERKPESAQLGVGGGECGYFVAAEIQGTNGTGPPLQLHPCSKRRY